MMIRFTILYNLLLSLDVHQSEAFSYPQGIEGAAWTRTLEQGVIPKHEVHCSRERSRTAWGIIEDVWTKQRYLMPFVGHEEYQIPSKCRLHPDNSMFLARSMELTILKSKFILKPTKRKMASSLMMILPKKWLGFHQMQTNLCCGSLLALVFAYLASYYYFFLVVWIC